MKGSIDTAQGQSVPERARPRRRLLTTAIPFALLLVLVTELAIRAGAPALREPLLWPGWEAQNKVAAMDRLSAQGGASVVYIGSSMVNAAADPPLTATLIGERRPAFNASLNGSDLRSFEAWTLGVVVPRLRPKVVVLGFNSGEINDRGRYQASFYTGLLSSPLGRAAAGHGDVLNRMESWLVENSYLVRYRPVLRRPMDAFSQDRARKAQAVDRFGTLRALKKFHQRPYQPGVQRQLANWEQVFANYFPGGDQLQALDRTVRGLTSRGIKVVIVRTPVTADVIPLHPHGAADRDAFAQVLNGFVASRPVTFVDSDAALRGDTTLFTDPLHLNGEGSKRFTNIVSRAVKPLL